MTCQLSCYDCPMQSNIFNSILTVDTLPNDLKDCSFPVDQAECSIFVKWTQNPDQTQIALIGGGERRLVVDEHNLQNTITLKNDGTKTQWTREIFYRCSTEKCNSPSILKRILRSLKSEDSFNQLSNLLQMNAQFNGRSCSFFANSSTPCETEMDPNTCKQCATQESIVSGRLETCLNCVMDDIIENFVTRQVKFFMNNRECHDLWMIECQIQGCNTIETGDSIRQKSTIEFDYNLFLNGSNKLTNLSWITIIISILVMFN
jgi:hypothetical protein